jgi:hypothetical protein
MRIFSGCSAAPIIAVLIFLGLSHPCAGQSTPFLSEEETRILINEISGDRAFEHIRWLTHWHRASGSEGYSKAVEYIMKAAEEAGLEDVKFIEHPLIGGAYNARSAELWMVEPVELKLADLGDCALYLADGSRDADVTAELVWIGDASEKSLEGLDVRSKIVLTSAEPSEAVRTAVNKMGAVGVISYYIASNKSLMDYPDQIAWSRVGGWRGEDGANTFAFMLPARKGETLRRILETSEEQDFFNTGKKAKGGKVILRAKVDTEFGVGEGKSGFVEGWIRGSKYHDQQIVLTAHIQEEKTSANDDASGCANLLEQARVLNKLIREGKIERPLRDIRFWWTDEILSEYLYFMQNPEEPKKMLANINQDMVGARQSMGDRVQHLIFAPFSRMSYLDTLLESIGTFVIRTNNRYLAAGDWNDAPTGYKRRIYSTLGSREAYNAAFVPYIDSSDQRCFVEGVIGVPAVALINWDDDFIHSSGDDLANIDPTQLQRNNFIVTAITYCLAFAEPDDVPKIAGETFASASKRMAGDLAVAQRLLLEGAAPDSRDEGWVDASIMIEQGALREVRALVSIRVFAGEDKAAQAAVDELIARVKAKERAMYDDIAACYRALHGHDILSQAVKPEEGEAQKKVPVNTGDLRAYFMKRMMGRDQQQSELHELMRDEVFNFVDGKRTYYDIYKAVRAEALAAGEWYYGEVTLQDVTALLDAAVAAKILEIK